MSEYVVRFGWRPRIEHLLTMIVFIVLVATGLPQKFFDTGWAQTIIGAVGGIERARWIHRMTGIVFVILVAAHLAAVTALIATGRAALSLVPTRKDFRDAVVQLRYYMALSDASASFGRYDYRQKFEYWGLLLGSLAMAVTGFILYFPIATTRFAPGEVIPMAKVIHSNEGLLAFLVVIIWHVYNAHLSPEVFPLDTTIFSGKISLERMQHEHPLEYEERLARERVAVSLAEPSAAEPETETSEAADVPP